MKCNKSPMKCNKKLYEVLQKSMKCNKNFQEFSMKCNKAL